MKLSKIQLRKLIMEEKKLIERRKFHQNRQELVSEGLGDIAGKLSGWAKSAKAAVTDVSDFVGGVKKFLSDHQDYIEPIYNMAKDLRNSQGTADSTPHDGTVRSIPPGSDLDLGPDVTPRADVTADFSTGPQADVQGLEDVAATDVVAADIDVDDSEAMAQWDALGLTESIATLRRKRYNGRY